MNVEYIKNNDSSELIIFFNGWGMDSNIVQHLNSEDFDVLTFFDYRTLNIDNSVFDEINRYKKSYLIAWSMGVGVSSLFVNKIQNLIKSTAINGTLKPIDDNFGIPAKAYDLTIENFNEITLNKFRQKMFLNKNDSDKIILPKRSATELKDELIALKNYIPNLNHQFDRTIISEQDKIFITKNQLNFWNTQPNTKITTLDTGHFPFFNYTNWSELL